MDLETAVVSALVAAIGAALGPLLRSLTTWALQRCRAGLSNVRRVVGEVVATARKVAQIVRKLDELDQRIKQLETGTESK